MHENLHKMWIKHVFSHFFMEIFNNFYEGQFKQQMLYTANFLYAF